MRRTNIYLADDQCSVLEELVVARRAGELMRRHRRSHAAIGLGDYLVAATAEVHGLEPATPNVEHFPMLQVLRPPFTLP